MPTPVALCLAIALAAAPSKRPYAVEDQVTLKRVLVFEVSPDGSRIAYALRSTDLEANRGRVDLWVVNSDGSGNRQLTAHPENETDPRWSPDGKTLYFLSARSGSNQVWRLSLEGGEPTQVTQSPVDL